VSKQQARGIWVSIIMLFAIVAAMLAGVAMRASGTGFPASLAAGGATFISMATLGLGIARFLQD